MSLSHCNSGPLGRAASSHGTLSSNSSTYRTRCSCIHAAGTSCSTSRRRFTTVSRSIIGSSSNNSSSSRATVLCRVSSYGSSKVDVELKATDGIGSSSSPSASLMSLDDLPDGIRGRAVGAIKDTLDDLTSSYKRLDASLDKDYINSVVSLRECLLEYEWRQHGKILAERKGVTKFERHCAENDVDVQFDVVSQLYKNSHDMSVLGDNNKLKLLARCIIMETVDEQYSSTYAECTALAKELAKTGITDMIPEGAEKMAGTIKTLIPMPAFLKKLF